LQKSSSAPSVAIHVPTSDARSTADMLDDALLHRIMHGGRGNGQGELGDATKDELLSALRRLHRSHGELDAIIRQLTQQCTDRGDLVESSPTVITSPAPATFSVELGSRSSAPRPRAVHFAGSPRPQLNENAEKNRSRPVAQCSVVSPSAVSPQPQRPDSPWATSSSAYGAHSSAASSSSASATAGSPTRSRIEAARMRTLALRAGVR
jgi:hypothetical protein